MKVHLVKYSGSDTGRTYCGLDENSKVADNPKRYTNVEKNTTCKNCIKALNQ